MQIKRITSRPFDNHLCVLRSAFAYLVLSLYHFVVVLTCTISYSLPASQSHVIFVSLKSVPTYFRTFYPSPPTEVDASRLPRTCPFLTYTHGAEVVELRLPRIQLSGVCSM